MKQARSFRARWILPVVGDPIDGGVVTVVDDRIVSVNRAADGPVEDLGDVVLFPGLVNAHTHLEYSDLQQPLGHAGEVFPRWIAEVIAWQRSRQVDPRASIELGLAESHGHGTTVMGEIARGNSWDNTLRPTADVTVFREVIGLQPARFAETLAGVDEFLQTRAHCAAWRPALSPHAPYTVHPALLAELVARANRHNIPLAMHIAESREELELLDKGTGVFGELLDSVGITWPHDDLTAFRRPLDYLRRLADAPRALVVHGNYLDAEEIAFLAEQQDRLTVVYCPRTHAYFHHDRHPLAKLITAGASVALGTDGRGSNPDLSMLAEMRHIAQEFAELSPRKIVELGTIDGAQALGVANEFGSLESGKRARIVAVPLGAASNNDPYASVLFGSSTQPRFVE